MARVQQVEGADGVRLSVDDRGDGEPVLLVHGTSGSAADWALVGRLLTRERRVLRYDRRGRGRSTDAAAYSMNAEVEDLLAVLAAVGEPVHLVAHSYGARLAVRAAARGPALRSLVLYEPPIAYAHVPEATYRGLLDADARGDREAVVAAFHALAGFTDEEVAGLRAMAWPLLLDAAPTIAREQRELRAHGADLDAAAAVTAPAVVLVGELTTSPLFLDGLEALASALRAPVVRLPGQRHLAPVTGAEAFVAALPVG